MHEHIAELLLDGAVGILEQVDLALEQAVQGLVRRAIADGLLASAHDSSDGGLAVALAESSIASGLGLTADLAVTDHRLERVLFAEGGARIVVSVKAEKAAAWQALLATTPDVPATPLGQVTDASELQIRCGAGQELKLPLAELQRAHADALPRRLA